MPAVLYNLQSIRAPLSGIGRYTYELLNGMLANDIEIEATYQRRKYNGPQMAVLLDRIKNDSTPGPLSTRKWMGSIPFAREFYRSYNQNFFRRAMTEELHKGAIYHDINYIPCKGASRSLATVYDLSHVSQASTHPLHRVRHLNRYFRNLSKTEQPVLTISHAIKEELCETYGIEPERIFVTPLGADNSFKPRPSSACEEVLDKYRLNYQQFVLCVGAIEPRKNLIRTLKAYHSLSTELKSQFPLVIAGPSGWKDKKINQEIDWLENKGFVHRLGYVPAGELPILYSAATAFLYPSLYEGFGLPVLEAMTSGCPVLSSDQGALSELAGQCSIGVNPTSEEEIFEGLNELLRNSSLRSSLSQKGLERALDFSWNKTVAATKKAYQAI